MVLVVLGQLLLLVYEVVRRHGSRVRVRKLVLVRERVRVR